MSIYFYTILLFLLIYVRLKNDLKNDLVEHPLPPTKGAPLYTFLRKDTIYLMGKQNVSGKVREKMCAFVDFLLAMTLAAKAMSDATAISSCRLIHIRP